MKKVGIGLATAILLSGVSLGSTPVGATIDNQTNKTAKLNATGNVESRATNQGKIASTRVSPSGRYQRFLLPVTKQTFKQNRRKELNKSRKKRNKK